MQHLLVCPNHPTTCNTQDLLEANNQAVEVDRYWQEIIYEGNWWPGLGKKMNLYAYNEIFIFLNHVCTVDIIFVFFFFMLNEFLVKLYSSNEPPKKKKEKRKKGERGYWTYKAKWHVFYLLLRTPSIKLRICEIM